MRRLVAAVLVSLAVASPAGGQDLQPVDARLLAGTSKIEAGKPFPVGVLLRMQRGWHVYWHNPGDAGLPTSVRWTMPQGFAVGPLRWPVPERFEQPGRVVGYGYAGAVLLTAVVTPPPTLALDATVPLTADVGWLACEALCVRGRKSLAVTIGPGAAPGTSDPALFAEWAPRVPADVDAKDAPATMTTRGGIPAGGTLGTVTVTLDWKQVPVSVEWFPPHDPALDVEAAETETGGGRTRLTFRAHRLPGQTPEQATLESVVAWTDGAGIRRGLRVPIGLDGKET
jgi:DsbC/DsbD-like thiol-disulfide interchange protein